MTGSCSVSLDRWLTGPGRRPRILRGACQVGKTRLVRDLAERSGLDLIELSFGRDPDEVAGHHTGKDVLPSRACVDLPPPALSMKSDTSGTTCS